MAFSKVSVTPVPAILMKLAANTGYDIKTNPLVYVRGWPRASNRPYQLLHADGGHIASFVTIDGLERNLRARAGC